MPTAPGSYILPFQARVQHQLPQSGSDRLTGGLGVGGWERGHAAAVRCGRWSDDVLVVGVARPQTASKAAETIFTVAGLSSNA